LVHICWGCNPCFAFSLSCFTNIKENINCRLEYQLCETGSIRTSTSINLERDKLSPPFPSSSTKVIYSHTLRSTQLYVSSASVMWALILTLATFTGVRETSLALKVPKSFGFEGTWGHNPISPKTKVSLCEPFGPSCLKTPSRGDVLMRMATNKHSLPRVPCANSLRKTDHYHRPSYLGKHFLRVSLTSIFDFIWTTSLGVTSPEKYTSAKNTQLHPFRY
jgi:hypothetical protein